MRCPRPHFPWSGMQIPSEASHRWHIGSSQGTDSTRWGQCPVGPVDSMRTWRCLILKPKRREKAQLSVFHRSFKGKGAAAGLQMELPPWTLAALMHVLSRCVLFMRWRDMKWKGKEKCGKECECKSVFQETTDRPDGIRWNNEQDASNGVRNPGASVKTHSRTCSQIHPHFIFRLLSASCCFTLNSTFTPLSMPGAWPFTASCFDSSLYGFSEIPTSACLYRWCL